MPSSACSAASLSTKLKRNLTDAEVASLRDVKVLILEENESFVGRSNYAPLLLSIIEK